jgi:hypothetical protein
MRDENLSLYAPYHALFCYWSPLREDTTRTVPHDLRDSTLSTRPRPVLGPSSTWPRPSLDPPLINRKERPTWHRTRSLFTVSSTMSPWCPGMADHSRGMSLQSPPQGSTKLHLKGTPSSLPPLPYKRAGQGSTKRGKRTTNNGQQKTSLHPTKEDQHLKQSPL